MHDVEGSRGAFPQISSASYNRKRMLKRQRYIRGNPVS